MTGKKALVILAFGVLMGTMAVAAFAEAPVMDMYDPADSSMSTDIGTSGAQTDAWELRESMETGALPDRPGSSPDAVCCRGIEGPTIESGGVLFRPEVDSGP